MTYTIFEQTGYAPSCLNLAFEAAPETEKPPLLMMHGLLSSRLHWRPNVALSQSFRLICVDLPGHGDSPPLQRAEDAHPKVMVETLEALRAHLGIERWHICGQSYGAGISLRYALDYPDRCLGHVFTNANAALRRDWPAEAQAKHHEQVETLRAGGLRAIRAMAYHPAHARRFPDDIREMLAHEADRVDPDTYVMIQEVAIPVLSVADRMDTLRVPTLLVNGLRERRFQPSRDWLAVHHPAMRIVDLDGGHSINVECPEAFNVAMTDFLLPLVPPVSADHDIARTARRL